MEPGSVVFCVEKADKDNVYFLGKGVYQGDKLIPGAEQIFEKYWESVENPEILEMTKEKVKELLFKSPLYLNPCIKLDTEQIVWGMQCWWMDEERFNKFCEGKNVIISKLEK